MNVYAGVVVFSKWRLRDGLDIPWWGKVAVAAGLYGILQLLLYLTK